MPLLWPGSCRPPPMSLRSCTPASPPTPNTSWPRGSAGASVAWCPSGSRGHWRTPRSSWRASRLRERCLVSILVDVICCCVRWWYVHCGRHREGIKVSLVVLAVSPGMLVGAGMLVGVTRSAHGSLVVIRVFWIGSRK